MLLNHKNCSKIYIYSKYYNNLDTLITVNKPMYHITPLYNLITNSNNFYYIEVEINDDICLLCYKIIQMFNLKQIRVFDIKSLKNNFDNVDLIIKHLKSLPFTKFVMSSYMFENCKYLSKDEKYDDYNDYYIDFNACNFNGQFRSKNRINILNKSNDFNVVLTNDLPIKEFSELLDGWLEYKSKSKINYNAYKKQLLQMIQSNSNSIKYLLIFYKDKLISAQMFLVYNNYVDCIFIIHLGRSANLQEDDILRKVLSNINNIQIYFAYYYLKDINVRYLFLAGCPPTERNLLSHKQRECDGFIQYYIDNNELNYTGLNNVQTNNKKLF